MPRELIERLRCGPGIRGRLPRLRALPAKFLQYAFTQSIRVAHFAGFRQHRCHSLRHRRRVGPVRELERGASLFERHAHGARGFGIECGSLRDGCQRHGSRHRRPAPPGR